MFCPNCGANIPVGFDSCPDCGTEISVTRSHEGGENDPFIVADDVREVHTPFGSVIPVTCDGETIPRPAIIEAEEEELPEGEANILQDPPDGDTIGSVLSAGDSLSDRQRGEGMFKESNVVIASSLDDREYGRKFGTDRDKPVSSGVSPSGDNPSHEPSPDTPAFEGFDDADEKSRSSDSESYGDLPSSSRKRPVIAGLAVMILVVLGLAILVYGLPGHASGDAGVPMLTLMPTPLPDVTQAPVTESVPLFTPSENLFLSISAYAGGYKVEIDGGLKANEVAHILLTVEDNGGIHTMKWAYPSRHESFYMAREAYNGTPSAIEHVTALATFTDGTKEVVFSGNL